MIKVGAANEEFLLKNQGKFDYCLLFSSFEQFLAFNVSKVRGIIQVEIHIPKDEIQIINSLPRFLRTYISFSDYNFDFFLDNVKILASNNIVINIHQSEDFGLITQFLASIGISSSIIIDDVKSIDMEELLDSFSYFQYASSSSVTIHPFHILCSVRGFENFNTSLKFVYQENHRNTYYLHETGEVSLSKRLYDLDESFTGKNISEAIATCKKYYTEVKQNIFLNKEECSFCRYYKLCESYLRTAKGFEEVGCKKFYNLFEMIQKEFLSQLNNNGSNVCELKSQENCSCK